LTPFPKNLKNHLAQYNKDTQSFSLGAVIKMGSLATDRKVLLARKSLTYLKA
jgi:hypothetical protein